MKIATIWVPLNYFSSKPPMVKPIDIEWFPYPVHIPWPYEWTLPNMLPVSIPRSWMVRKMSVWSCISRSRRSMFLCNRNIPLRMSQFSRVSDCPLVSVSLLSSVWSSIFYQLSFWSPVYCRFSVWDFNVSWLLWPHCNPSICWWPTCFLSGLLRSRASAIGAPCNLFVASCENQSLTTTDAGS